MEEKILSVIETLIQKSMKERGELKTSETTKEQLAVVENKLKTLRMMKAELIKVNDKKEYVLTKEQEVKTLTKMKEEREKYVDVYTKANREELAQTLKDEISVISQFIPEQPKDKEIIGFTEIVINNYLSEQVPGYQLSKRDMGKIMPLVKAFYPNVNGKIVEKVLTSKIES